MRKRVVPGHPTQGALADEDWLHVEGLAEVEVTSEALPYPVDGAFLSSASAGWRASGAGAQTQEYTWRWSHGYGESFHEIVRQQWNFSPHGATCEVEDHYVELPSVAILELTIIPDVRIGSKAVASLAHWRLA